MCFRRVSTGALGQFAQVVRGCFCLLIFSWLKGCFQSCSFATVACFFVACPPAHYGAVTG